MTTTPTSDLLTALGDDPGVERLYDNLQAEVPGVILANIKLVVWNTIEDFFIQSTFLREHVYWRMAAGVKTVDFNPFDEARKVFWILDYSGLPNGKVEPPSVLRDLTFPVPTVERAGEAWLALKPVSFDMATSCHEFPELWSTRFETLMAGALYRLYAQPGKPYSDGKLAAFHARVYRRGVAQARDEARRYYSAGRAVAFPYFARGRR